MKQFFFYLLMLVQSLVTAQATDETYPLDSDGHRTPGCTQRRSIKMSV